jgi:mRNA interferase MazF
MMIMTGYSFGDIILVPFPFTDQSTTKKRPAVVVSSSEYNQKRPDVILAAVTSKLHSANYFGDVPVESWQQAGLLKPSVIKPVELSASRRFYLSISLPTLHF